MWLINSSIGRKVVMSVTGIALVLFLTFHASMNVVALISAKGYNMICEFLGANWYAVVATIGLAGLVALHFIYAFWLTIQNQKARGNSKYAITDKPEKVEWASQNMLVLGIIVIVGMGLHLYNFWYNMMWAELAHIEDAEPMAANGVFHIINTFHGGCPSHPATCWGYGYTAIYLVWLAALWFHLTHGIWSAMQTLGISGKIWFQRWKCIGNAWAAIVVLMFAAVAIAFCAGHTPCDFKEAMHESMMKQVVKESPCGMMKPGCPGKPGHCGEMKPGCPGKPGHCGQKPCGGCAEKAGCPEGGCAGKPCGEKPCGGCPNE